jgi:hypothetical protein
MRLVTAADGITGYDRIYRIRICLSSIQLILGHPVIPAIQFSIPNSNTGVVAS